MGIGKVRSGNRCLNFTSILMGVIHSKIRGNFSNLNSLF